MIHGQVIAPPLQQRHLLLQPQRKQAVSAAAQHPGSLQQLQLRQQHPARRQHGSRRWPQQRSF